MRGATTHLWQGRQKLCGRVGGGMPLSTVLQNIVAGLFSSFPNLVCLDLSHQGLNGIIPPQIDDLVRLEHLNLSKNDLTGTLPSSLGNLTQLRMLDVSFNYIDSISSKFGNLKNLVSLNMTRNNLTASIAPIIGLLTNLSYLELAENPFHGCSIPPEIWNLKSLVALDRNLRGSIYFEWNHYKLVANGGKNMLHGFSDVIWKVKKYKNKGHASSIVFSYHSHSYEGEEVECQHETQSLQKAAPVNLAQHTYWNLGGHNSGDILSEEVQIFASSYTPVDSSLIPTGKIASVKGTPYDFLNSHTIKSTINKLPNGYDINYVLDGTPGKLRKAAVVKDKKSGRVMKLYTNQPGVQFYTGNYLKDVKGKDGFVYQAHAGLCSETQGFPDSVNHPNFPSQIVNPGKTYKHHMLYKFSVEA
ncbi:hypothetical protein SLEP1_g20286 [Rubroshorea leprosula]|uniref:Disease resistance R13L4/SHOC-2-like LRR domain-containing protein n=1 Tax=Rubroshorea leprosula TaxID=152421 RepID=A0AAV5JBC9_9ROSI|nr:hypothetical protein SLEP1_g20286 [Rubroshorea leprosula]